MKVRYVAIATANLLLVACGNDDSGNDDSGHSVLPTPQPFSPVPEQTQSPVVGPTRPAAPESSSVGEFSDSDGVTYRARKLEGTADWLVDAENPVEGIYMLGQSNAGSSGAAGDDAFQDFIPFPKTVVTNNHGPVVSTATTSAASATSFIPLNSAAQRKSLPNHLDLIATEQFGRDRGQPPTGLYGFTVFDGGQTIKRFLPATSHYRNLLADVRSTAALARLYGRSFIVRAVVYHQGEHSTTGYAADLEQIIDGLQRDIPAITGQPMVPEFMIRQVSSRRHVAGSYQTPQDQFEVAFRRRNQGVTLIGPTYFGELSDSVHFTTSSRAVLADVAGVAIDAIRSGRRFIPLWPIQAERSGRQIDVTFEVPGNGLMFDRDLVPATDDEGFIFTDSVNSASVQSVSIVGSRTVRILLDKEPVGMNGHILYAMGNNMAAERFPIARGTLYSPSSQRSVYARFNVAAPDPIRHYAVRFRLPVP